MIDSIWLAQHPECGRTVVGVHVVGAPTGTLIGPRDAAKIALMLMVAAGQAFYRSRARNYRAPEQKVGILCKFFAGARQALPLKIDDLA